MNHQLYKTDDPCPPYQFNWNYRSSTQMWSGTDSQGLFLANLANPVKKQMLTQLGWDSCNISYQYNSHGFRCDEFDDRPCGLALGCSHTHGVGLPVDCTWSHLLTQLTGTHVWNLGSGGAAIDTVFRIFDCYVTRLLPKFVCVLVPPLERFEYKNFENGFPIISVYDHHGQDKFAKEWLCQDHNSQHNTRKTLLAMAKICDDLGIPFIVNDSSDPKGLHHTNGLQPDLARDLQHSGTIYQKYHADYMHNKIKELNIAL